MSLRTSLLPLPGLALALMLSLPSLAARAQGLGTALPTLPPVAGGTVDGIVGQRARPLLRDDPLHALRRLRVDALLRSERARLDVDPRGAPVLRGEFLATGLDAAGLDAVRAAGFDVVGDVVGDAGPGLPTTGVDDVLGLDLRVLRDRRGRRASRAMRALQRAVPAATFAYQHLYLPAGVAASSGGPQSGARPATPPPSGTGAASTVVPSGQNALRIGLVDGGVDATVPALSRMRVERHGCPGEPAPQAHGTTVAARLAGGLQGTLYAADLWCGDAVGRATLGLVQALGWMARERVPVVNISLVGPDNAVLARAVQAMVARGHVLVGAVGNDGPAAPPLYPAAYPGVIGVSGVDARLRVLPESGSGPHVDFSAPGVVPGNGLRGTSFAAPLVARLAAGMVDAPAPGTVERVERALATRARDLGKPGRDPRYGVGLVDPEI